MIATKEAIFTKDEANKTMSIVRDFDAPVELVWKCWTEPELMDKWWAPKPWKAVTQSQDFRDGGTWRYYMEGPDGTRHYCLANFEKIVPNKSYSALDAFCDENGVINTEFPRMHWDLQFNKAGKTTKVEIMIKFEKLEDMQKILEMGFKEGFSMAHGNLDELLASLQS